MMTYDLRPFVASVIRQTWAHASAELPGAFSRWSWQDAEGKRQLGPSIYGTADAVHVLYTLDALPRSAEQRASLISRLQAYQDPADGLYREAPLHPLHTTAFAAGALTLLDASPKQEASGLRNLATREGLYALLNSLDWADNPWAESHRGAGVFASMLLAGNAAPSWQDWYFSWLWENQDPETGLWRKGCVKQGKAPRFHHLASSFHYLFNHDHARRALRYTEPLIDTCLDMAAGEQLPALGKGLSWNEIDWVYTLRSLQKRSPHRSAELKAELERVRDLLLPAVLKLDVEHSEDTNDLHTLFAGLCALAVLQEALPGSIRTDWPLRLVLDRKPFL